MDALLLSSRLLSFSTHALLLSSCIVIRVVDGLDVVLAKMSFFTDALLLSSCIVVRVVDGRDVVMLRKKTVFG